MRQRVPQVGDVRQKSWFAFLPVQIGPEQRWLERVTTEQQLCLDTAAGGERWVDMRFVDPEDTQQTLISVLDARLRDLAKQEAQT